MKIKILLISILATLLVPQYVGAFSRAVYRVGEQEYMFIADNVVNPPQIGKESGFKVRIQKVNTADDPDYEAAEPVPDLERQLRLNIRHEATNARQTVPLTETEAGLYTYSFTPSAGGKFIYTVAVLLDGIPVNIPFECTDGSASTDGTGESAPDETVEINGTASTSNAWLRGQANGQEAPAAGSSQVQEISKEGSITCPVAKVAATFFPPQADNSDNSDNGTPAGSVIHAAAFSGTTMIVQLVFYSVTLLNLMLSAFLSFLVFRDLF